MYMYMRRAACLQRVLCLREQVVQVLVVQLQVAHAHHRRPLCRAHLCEQIEQRARDDTRLVATTLGATPHNRQFQFWALFRERRALLNRARSLVGGTSVVSSGCQSAELRNLNKGGR